MIFDWFFRRKKKEPCETKKGKHITIEQKNALKDCFKANMSINEAHLFIYRHFISDLCKILS